jgi:hypothetical protein
MGFAFAGLLHPLIAALAMLGSSLFVLHNSLRLSKYGGALALSGLAWRSVSGERNQAAMVSAGSEAHAP